MIRKEVSESSWKDESEGQGRVRRSRRAPVPNTLYREALKELKKVTSRHHVDWENQGGRHINPPQSAQARVEQQLAQ